MRTLRPYLLVVVLMAAAIGLWYLLHGHTDSSAQVAARSQAVSAACKDIPGMTERRECYGETITKLIHTLGISSAFSVVSDLYIHDPAFRNRCHYSVHAIGKAAYSEYKRSHSSNFITSDASFCNYGFYHGFMIALLADTKDVHAAKEFCDTLPAALIAQRGDSDNQCYHGMGHGFVESFIEQDTPHETDLAWVKKEERAAVPGAISSCKMLSSNQGELSSCYSGVFHDLALLSEDQGWAIDPKDPLWLCEEMPQEYQQNCTGNTHRLAMQAMPNASLTEVAAFAAAQYGTSTSFFSNIVWRWAGTHTKTLGPEAVVASCRTLESWAQWACISGSLADLEDNGIPQQEYKAVSAFCSMAALSNEEQRRCSKHAFNYFKGIYPADKLQSICSTYAPLYDESCR